MVEQKKTVYKARGEAGRKRKRKKQLMMAIIGLLVIAIVAGGIGGYKYMRKMKMDRQNKQEAINTARDNLSVSFLNEGEVNALMLGSQFKGNSDGGVFEYSNVVINPIDLVGQHTGKLTLQGNGPIDTQRVGNYEIIYHVSETTAYGDEVYRDYTKHYTVEDTVFPTVSIKQDHLTFTEGDEFDPRTNVESVTDPVDGELSFTIDTTLNMKIPGEYTVTVKAKDVNGNEASASFGVTVNAKPVPESSTETTSSETSSVPESSTETTSSTTETTSSTTETSSTPASSTESINTSESTGAKVSDGYNYAIYVNCAANTVTVYAKDDSGNYTVPYKAMVCSTGPATPRGTYYTYDDPSNSRWSPYYPWWPLYGGVYGMYAYGITGDILFHSVPYYSANPGDLEYEEYNKLGTAASMGCVRLAVKDVLWIFQHCPKGTMVVFYDDASNPGPLGKPDPIYIDPSSPNRGWDPTDPNPDNPWNS